MSSKESNVICQNRQRSSEVGAIKVEYTVLMAFLSFMLLTSLTFVGNTVASSFYVQSTILDHCTVYTAGTTPGTYGPGLTDICTPESQEVSRTHNHGDNSSEGGFLE